MRSKRASEPNPVHGIYVQFIHQQAYACIKRRFRQLNRPYVVLRDRNPNLSLVQDIGEGASICRDPL